MRFPSKLKDDATFSSVADLDIGQIMQTNGSYSPISERSRKFFDETSKSCLPKIDRFSIPILGVQDDQIRHDRTGVLYRIANDYFVLTAAHDLPEIVNANIPLYLSVNKPGVMPIPLGEAKFHSTEKVGRDVSAIWLPPQTVEEVAKHKDFLAHNQIDLNGADSRGPFVFLGYPMDWSGHLVSDDYVRSVGLAFATSPHSGQMDEDAFFDPKLHVAMNFSRDGIQALTGQIDHLPKPKGISGCGVWQIGDMVDGELRPRNENTVTLVAIQHRWFPLHDYIQATRIGWALSYIIENYPGVRASMEIAYPKH